MSISQYQPTMTGEIESSSPIFILSAARSGSTLIRLLLDAHPAIACPPELNLSSIFSLVEHTTMNLHPGDRTAAEALANTVSRQLADATLFEYARRSGKSIVCEKSLPSLEHSELLLRLFPRARFICLYRECLDTIASLLEATPWGYNVYGLEPYVRAYPANLVFAFATFWLEKASLIHGFEQRHPEICHRVRYEDVVLDTTRTLEPLFAFAGVEWDADPHFVEHALRQDTLRATGDYKVRYTGGIETRSVGRGWQVPLEFLPDVLVNHVNQLNAALGYDRLDGETRLAAMTDASATVGSDVVSPPLPPAIDRSDVSSGVIESIGELVHRRVTSRLAEGGEHAPEFVHRVQVAVADNIDASWAIDFQARRVLTENSFDDATHRIVTDTATLLAIANGTCNPGVALRQSRIKVTVPDSEPPDAGFRHVDAVMALIVPEQQRAAAFEAPAG